MAGPSHEMELKLELTAEAAESLLDQAPFSGTPDGVRQRAIYFDTPDHDLSKAGMSLRVRRNGDTRIQTIKMRGAGAGMFVRPEWERGVADDTPVLDDISAAPALVRDHAAAIKPLFTVETERQLWNGEGVEIALDRGRIVAGDRETPFCEVELELKAGDPAALFALARRIDAIVPVHLGVLSKAERGYRLLGPMPSATKADPVDLNADMHAEDAFKEIANACLRQFRLNAPLILDQGDAAALHQARVALRRLRSALSIHKPMLGEGGAEALNDELRWLAGALGDARDLDVLTERAGEGSVQDRLVAARGAAYADAKDALRSDRARALMLDIAEWIAIGPWQTGLDGADLRALPTREFAGQALDRFRGKVKKGGRHLEDLDDEARHDVRKAAKKLRYAAEFFAALYAGKRERRHHKRFVSSLEALQDRLGALNDLATAPEVIGKLGLADAPEAEDLVGSDKKNTLIAAAAEAYDALVDAKRFWRG